MDLSRRGFLQAAVFTAAASGLTVACGGDSESGGTKNGKSLTMWYWGGALSDKVVAEAKTHFKSQIKLTSSSIGGDFKQKLTTTLAAGGSSVPDITGIKGEDIASFLPNADRFLDLNDLGFKKISSQYLEWKTKLAQTEDGKQIGFPIDIGPTALFYRADQFDKAGLPSDPAKVAAEAKTWDDYFALGTELKKALPGTFLVNNMGSVFNIAVGQGTKRFIDQDDHFIGDQDHIRAAWDTAVRAYTLGLDAKINDQSWNAAVGKSLTTELGAAWHALDIESAAPGTKGKWRVCATPAGRPTRRLLPDPAQAVPQPRRGVQDHQLDPQPGQQRQELHRRRDLPGLPGHLRDAGHDGPRRLLRRTEDHRGLRPGRRGHPRELRGTRRLGGHGPLHGRADQHRGQGQEARRRLEGRGLPGQADRQAAGGEVR